MKRIRIISVLEIVLCCILLCGCDYRNYIYTEDSLKNVAKKSLEEKYGEEFVIHRVWNKSQTVFFADCSPKDNSEVVFRADIRKNGEGIVSDGYAQGVVAKEVDDVLKDDFKELFGECCTEPAMINYYNVPTFENASEVKVDEYLAEVNLNDMMYSVYINATAISNESIDEEYRFIATEIPDKINKKKIPDLRLRLFFITDDLMRKCKNFLSTNVELDSDLYFEVDKYPEITIEYKNGSISEVYEGFIDEKYGEYQELRKNIDKKIFKEDK